MKINLKNKIMLAVFAGNMLYMGQALAVGSGWFGTTTGFVCEEPDPPVTTGVNLSIYDDTINNDGGVPVPVDYVDYIYGGYNAVDNILVSNNALTFNLTYKSVCCSINAGYSEFGNVTNNTITINSGTFDYCEIFGGCTNEGSATGNKVTINDGTFDGCNIYAGCSVNGNVTNNTTIINSGNFTGGAIRGGSIDSEGSGAAIGNSVTINGGIFNNVDIFVGYSETTSSNNTLNIRTKIDGKPLVVGYSQNMNFTLPANIQAGDTMLSTTGLAVDTAGGTATINVYAANGVKLNAGDRITLVKADMAIDTFVAGAVLGGADVSKIIFLDENGAEINPTGLDGSVGLQVILEMLKNYISGGGDDQQKAPVEGIAAGVAMLNQSADLASGEGMTSLQKETADGFANTFGAITATRSKYKTGSHVDMDGWGFLVGAGNTINWNNGQKTAYGLFFEYGKGDFDTYNNDIHGEGDSNNKGVGVIARHTLKNNTYIDGAVRYGKQETEWSETDIGGYDTDSRYYGAALGLGHIYPLGKNEIDIYGRYSFGHTGASDAKVGDNNYHFDSVKSHRLRVGTKLNIIVKGKKVKPYVGLAWEHEFNGESKATITGVGEAPAPSLKGNTGIFEIGCDWDTGKWTLGAEANAYIGKRKGWSGMANAFYNF